MAKLLSVRDWDFNTVGTLFELDEVTPVFEQEHRTDENDEVIKYREGKPRNFTKDSVKVKLECSMQGNPMYYRAEKIDLA